MLQELFEKCLQEVDGNKTRASIRFLVAAKKAKPDVTLSECMEVAGFTDPDEKKAANLAQSFRSTVFNPLRDHLAKVKFGVNDTTPIFGRGDGRTEENKKIRGQILGLLPAMTRSRVATQATSKDLSFVDDLLTTEEEPVA